MIRCIDANRDLSLQVVSKRLVLSIRKVLQSLGIIWWTILRLTVLVLPHEEQPKDLGADEADNEADHDASETLVVTGGIRSSCMLVTANQKKPR